MNYFVEEYCIGTFSTCLWLRNNHPN